MSAAERLAGALRRAIPRRDVRVEAAATAENEEPPADAAEEATIDPFADLVLPPEKEEEEKEKPADEPAPVIVVPKRRRRRKQRKRAKNQLSDRETAPSPLALPPVAPADPETRAAAQASAFPWAEIESDNLPVLKTAPRVREVSGGARAGDRRRHPRGRFEQKVIAMRDRRGRPLVGRDLSLGGMRVERCPDLEVGQRFKIAIYASAREEPFFMRAKVVVDYGERGFGLEFEELERAAGERLAKLVVGLPAIESLQDPELESVIAMLCETLPDDD